MELKSPSIRHLNDMKRVLADQEWAKHAPNYKLYYMYRGLKTKGDLRYDITIIPPRTLGEEFVKTKGHNHIGSFGEIYIVLAGEGIYLMQKYEKGKIKDVVAIKGKKGDVIVIPPYYGHVTINPSKRTLKTANWVSKNCQVSYNFFEKRQGACYYFTKSGWLKNRNYKNTPKLRFKKPRKTMPKNLDFLEGK